MPLPWFAADAAELPPQLASYAGVAFVDGPTAQAYSDLVAVHMQGIGGGKTYPAINCERIAGGMKDTDGPSSLHAVYG